MSDFPYCRGQHPSECIVKNENSEVWRGRDNTNPQQQRNIIWKEFHFAKDAFCLQSEIRLQPNLLHPFIAPVLASKELTRSPNKAHFVMIFECFPDVLEQLSFKKEGLTEERIIDILGMAISALVHMQNEGIAHRDIKPDNLFIDQDGNLQIGDFGIAKEYNSCLSKQTGDKGTPSYMSPILRNAKSSIRHDLFKSDVYSLGITCLQLVWKISKKQLEERVSYASLSSLPDTVENLQLSDGLKKMMKAMLTYEERKRPDFFQLMYSYANFWPEKRRFFSNQLIRYCDVCGELADVLCICSENLPGFCANCITEHKTICDDIRVRAADINKIKRREDIRRLRERTQIAGELRQGLQEVLSEYQRQIQERAAWYDYWIATFKTLKQQEENEFRAFSARLDGLIDQMEKKYEEERLDESTLLFDHWRTVSKPYATLTTTPSETFQLGQLSVEDEKIQLLENEERPVGPLFKNGGMSLCCLQTHDVLRTISTHSLKIDEETAIVLLGYSGVVGCGSAATPHQQCFTINFATDDIRSGQTRCPRIAPAIVKYQGVLYVFGGRDSKQAEAIDLKFLSSTPLPDLPIVLSRGTPCQYKGCIYLPAISIHIYIIATASYKRFLNVQPFEFASLLVHEDRFYVFSNRYTFETNVETKTRTMQKPWQLDFESRPSPVLLGDCVFFFNSADGQLTKYKIK